MEHIARLLTDKLVQMDIVKVEERELYEYGFWQGAVLVFNFATVVVIGLFFKMLWQSLIFMLAYSVLRPVAGGYHARTQRNCYIFSIVLLLAILALLQWFPWTMWWGGFAIAVSVVIIFILAPVEDENKPLDEIEQLVYKKRSRWITILLSVTASVLLVVGLQAIAYCIAVALLSESIMLILGQIKNMKAKN